MVEFNRKTRLLCKKYKFWFYFLVPVINYKIELKKVTRIYPIWTFSKLHVYYNTSLAALLKIYGKNIFLLLKTFSFWFVLVFSREHFLVIQVFVCFMLIKKIMFA